MTSSLGPICLYCTHVERQPDGRKVALPLRCKAFPGGVLQSIVRNDTDHRQPVEGDHGIHFEAMSQQGAAYAELVFGGDEDGQGDE
jgi:hypothetical protein